MVMNLKLHHYSAYPDLTLENFHYIQSMIPLKPSGIWVSVEGKDDWKQWCDDNGFESYVGEFINGD